MNRFEWDAKWIWDAGEESLKNYWLCFKKRFLCSESFDRAVLNLTADANVVAVLVKRDVAPCKADDYQDRKDT